MTNGWTPTKTKHYCPFCTCLAVQQMQETNTGLQALFNMMCGSGHIWRVRETVDWQQTHQSGKKHSRLVDEDPPTLSVNFPAPQSNGVST